MLTLLVMQGPDKGRRFELPDAPALIGRESRQLPLTDNTCSRRHAELFPRGGEWILKDLGSSNGSYVNGVRVENIYTLKLGDQIRVGKTILVFGAQAGIARASNAVVSLSGEEAGMESSIINTVQSNDDSMVLAVPEPAAAAMTNLKLLYQLGAALGSSFTALQVLEVVMDLVFEHVTADRGMILLLDEKKNELVPKVVRVRDEDAERKPSGNGNGSRSGAKSAGDTDAPIPVASDDDEQPAEPPKFHASRTIVSHVLNSGEGVLSSNAMTDQRFSKSKSIHNMGIRSSLCVPIKTRRLDPRGSKPGASPDEVIGVIYIDSSVKNYTYSPDQLRLLSAIGLQAGMAIQNAKLFQQGLAAERLTAIGETTAALSHSIKNILQALRGGADVVEMGLKSTNVTQAQKGWRIVDRNLEKIYNLTMNLLAYSRPREPQLEMINPKVLIEECLELIAPMANEKGVMAVADVDKDHPAVPLDPDGLHQIIMNLLSNALDAVEPGEGLIRVVCRYDGENKQTVIEVEDNGPGIQPSMMSHLFELFHSTKGNRGTGIGLAVTKKIVEEHEGSISVKSAPGEGTTFTVKLPVYHETMSDPSHTHGPAR
ncbi:MAG: FHA domain-containing protein [Anaerolineae bacterium]|nr:FHA domain-containing protein [Phycisphaerae bacterium]